MDFDSNIIEKITGIVQQGIKGADAAISLTKNIREMRKDLGADNKSDIDSAIVDLMDAVVDTRLANIELKEQIVVLREALLHSNQVEDKFRDYELVRVNGYDHVYSLKAGAKTGEGQHYICPNCVEDGVKSILQGGSGSSHILCNRCKTPFRRGEETVQSVFAVRGKWDVFDV